MSEDFDKLRRQKEAILIKQSSNPKLVSRLIELKELVENYGSLHSSFPNREVISKALRDCILAFDITRDEGFAALRPAQRVWPKAELEKAARPPEGWISVEERMPEEDGEYLWLLSNGRMKVEYLFSEIRYSKLNATHWQPLPQPPVAPKGEG